jgi:hypothetical protein
MWKLINKDGTVHEIRAIHPHMESVAYENKLFVRVEPGVFKEVDND